MPQGEVHGSSSMNALKEATQYKNDINDHLLHWPCEFNSMQRVQRIIFRMAC